MSKTNTDRPFSKALLASATARLADLAHEYVGCLRLGTPRRAAQVAEVAVADVAYVAAFREEAASRGHDPDAMLRVAGPGLERVQREFEGYREGVARTVGRVRAAYAG